MEAAIARLAARALEREQYGPAELVFGSQRGTPLQPSNFRQRVWTAALQKAGLGRWTGTGRNRKWANAYRFHDARHTLVSRLVADGADIKLVQAVAGHARAEITLNRYSHLADGRITEAALRVDPSGTAEAPPDNTIAASGGENGS